MIMALRNPPKPKIADDALLGSRFSAALTLSADIHREQLRKGTNIPYIAHVLGVTSIALTHGADEDEAIGADAVRRLMVRGS
jgi:(p)ppGpp synthase/HD superfamily hydrolase